MSRAEGETTWLREVSAARIAAPQLTEFRLSLERLERSLNASKRLVVAPSDVELWLEDGSTPPFLDFETAPKASGEPR